MRRGDVWLIDRCAERIHRHLEIGWDRVLGGLIHAVRVNRGAFEWQPECPVGTALELRFRGEYHYIKAFWSLAEVLVATLKVLKHRPATWALEYFERAQNDFDARKVEAPPHATRQANDHHQPALMLALETFQRMRASRRSAL